MRRDLHRFDDNITDAFGNVQTTSSGSLAYSDAFYGKGVKLNNGFILSYRGTRDLKFNVGKGSSDN